MGPLVGTVWWVLFWALGVADRMRRRGVAVLLFAPFHVLYSYGFVVLLTCRWLRAEVLLPCSLLFYCAITVLRCCYQQHGYHGFEVLLPCWWLLFCWGCYRVVGGAVVGSKLRPVGGSVTVLLGPHCVVVLGCFGYQDAPLVSYHDRWWLILGFPGVESFLDSGSFLLGRVVPLVLCLGGCSGSPRKSLVAEDVRFDLCFDSWR